MLKRHNGKHQLVHALLASSLFATTMVHGNTYGPGTTVGPVLSSATVDNVIQILDSGQIKSTGANNAVELDKQDAKLIIDANNFYVGKDAVLSESGIAINITASNTIVNIGADSGVHSTKSIAILTTNVIMPQIFNAGTIKSDASDAVGFTDTSNPLFEQSVGAITVNNTSPANVDPTIFTRNGTGLRVSNAGIIETVGAGDNLYIQSSFTEINNKFAGQILTIFEADDGDNFNINIGNNGDSSGGGNILLDAGSVIATYNDNTEFPSAGNIYLDSGVTMHNIQNAGLMLAHAGQNIWLRTDSTLNLITNEGLITNDNNIDKAALFLQTNSSLNKLENSGVIFSENVSTILGSINPSGTFNDGIFNTGNLLNGNPGLLTAENVVISNVNAVSVFQQGGLIVGDIGTFSAPIPARSPNTSTILTVSDGVIAGNFLAQIDGTTETFELSGGAFTGALVTGGDNDNIFNLSGTRVNVISGASTTTNTLNITGGHFNLFSHGLNNDPQPITTINIQDDFSSGAIIYFNTLNVMNPGTVYRIDAPILYETLAPASAINTASNTTTMLHAPILHGDNNNANWSIDINNAGKFVVEDDQIIQLSTYTQLTFVNTGILSIDSNSSLMIIAGPSNDEFKSLSGSTYEVGVHGPLGGPVDYGHIVMYSQTNKGQSAALFEAGSTIVPSFTGFLPDNTEMNIFNLNSAYNWNFPFVTDNSALKQPPSAVIFFTKNLSDYDQDILLTSHRRPYRSLSSSAATYGVSGALDVLAQGSGPTDPDLYYLLSQLDQLPTQESLEHAMQSLAPPFNNGVQAGSHLAMKAIFNNVSDRIWDFSYPYRFTQTGRERTYPWDLFGFNGGDQNHKPFGVWLNPIGVYAEQGSRDNVPGYRARGLGGIIGVDWQRDNCTLLGFAGSFVKMSVADRNIFPKDEAIKSWQGTFYGSFEYVYGIYLDAILGIGHNHYTLNRVISVNELHAGANATFSGVQWSVQTDLGMVLPSDSMWLIAPFIRLQYLNLQWGDYTEVGAGDINLAVTNSSPTNFMGGIGVRFATAIPYGCCDLIPDVTLLLGNDFQQDAAPSSAYFIGGGPLFVTPNALPRRTIIDLGVGFNILTATDSILTFKYDLELRSQYYAHTFNLQYYFPWS